MNSTSKLAVAALLLSTAQAQHMTMPMSTPVSHSMPARSVSGATVNGATISGAFVAAQPPTATDTAAFLVLKNTGKKVLVLTGGASAAAQSAMLMDFVKLGNGQMSMKMVDKFVLAPGQSLTLAPGGKHLMLMGLKKPLKVGESLPITLHFAGGATLNVTAPVQKF